MKSLEYLAGLFDGEGSFSIQVSLRQHKQRPPSLHFNPALSVNLYYGAEVLHHFRERFGGAVYEHTQRGARWGLNGIERVQSAAQALEPYLEIKRLIARRFLEALALFPARGGVDQRAGGRMWTAEAAIAVAEIALSLNPETSRKSPKGTEYLDEFKASVLENYR